MAAQLLGRTPDVRERLVVDACAQRLAGVRRHVRDTVISVGTADGRSSTDPDLEQLAAELELVVSELATNVILHTNRECITVGVERTDDGWVVEVDGADALVDPIADHAPPGDEPRPGGRGLVIVRALTDAVDVVERDGARLIRCLKRQR